LKFLLLILPMTLFSILWVATVSMAASLEIEVPGAIGTYPIVFPNSVASIDSIKTTMSGTWTPHIYCCEEDEDTRECGGTSGYGIWVDVGIRVGSGYVSWLVSEAGEREATIYIQLAEVDKCSDWCDKFADGNGDIVISFDYSAIYHGSSGGCSRTLQEASVDLDSPVVITFYYSPSVSNQLAKWGYLKALYR